jgi:hypothetical protein
VRAPQAAATNEGVFADSSQGGSRGGRRENSGEVYRAARRSGVVAASARRKDAKPGRCLITSKTTGNIIAVYLLYVHDNK